MSASSLPTTVRFPTAVVFDLDGVIVDSEIWWHQVRSDWASGRGLSWSREDTAAVMGANSRGWARIMRERLRLPERDEAGILRDVVDGVVARFEAEGAPLIPGAVEAVRAVAERLPVAIASSAHRDVIAAALRTTGLDRVVPIAVSSDEVAHGKPAPDVYLEAAARLGIGPAGCLAVEDSLNGLLAARAAGMTVVLIPNASIPPAPGADRLAHEVLTSLEALAARISSVDGQLREAPARDAPARPASNQMR